MSSIRTKLVTLAAVAAAAVGGAAVANAATSSSTASPSSSASPPGPPPGMVNGRHTANGRTEQPLSGTLASKVRAAALAKVSGTVERVETNVDSSAPYEAHIRKADGTEVVVEVDRDFTVAAVDAMGRHP